jgi:hypothetical protein
MLICFIIKIFFNINKINYNPNNLEITFLMKITIIKIKMVTKKVFTNKLILFNMMTSKLYIYI